jgi:hypothetical protein
MRIDFAYMQALQAKARRERSEAMYRMLLAPLMALLKRPAPPKETVHAPGPHLARQG